MSSSAELLVAQKLDLWGGSMRACFKLWSVVAVGLAVLSASLRAEFVYVANAGSNNVSAYRIAESGALTPVAGSPFPAGSDPRSLAVDLFGLFVYVANAASNNVSAYSIGPNGALTPVAGSPFPAGRVKFQQRYQKSHRLVILASLDCSSDADPLNSLLICLFNRAQ